MDPSQFSTSKASKAVLVCTCERLIPQSQGSVHLVSSVFFFPHHPKKVPDPIQFSTTKRKTNQNSAACFPGNPHTPSPDETSTGKTLIHHIRQGLCLSRSWRTSQHFLLPRVNLMYLSSTDKLLWL